MAFNQKELDIIKYGAQNGKSRQEVEQAISNLRMGIVPKKAEPAPVVAPSLSSKLLERGKTAVSEITGQPAQKILKSARPESGADIALAGTEALVRTAEVPVRIAGAVGGAIGDVIGAGVNATGIPEAVAPIIKPAVEAIAPHLKPAIDAFKSLPQDTQEQLSSLFDASNLALLGLGKKAGEKVVEKTVDVTKQGIEAGKKIVEKPLGVISGLADDVSRIPARMATNIAEKQAIAARIETLPTETVKSAARNGIEVSDVADLYLTPKQNVPVIKELAETAKKFALGETKTNPIEIVGKPIVQRIKELNSAKGKVGQELGVIADNLGVVSQKELFTPVFESLKKVSGLNGLTVNKGGVLNFKNTTLATARNDSARNYIQSVFDDATKWGNGKNKHLLRQELFEELGGKKKAQIALNDTEEKAINAIRQGLSDVLESKNAGYKAKSAEYRKIIQPLNDMKKMLRNIDPNASDDILNMSAGILARRLTSHAPSRAQIKQILKSMDEATAVKGGTQVSVENLQDVYNILDKYYDIAGKTSFQGQVTAGVEKATGVGEFVVGKLREVAGETPAVRQKALEDALKEILGG